MLGRVPLGKWPDFSKIKLNSNIKLFDLSNNQRIDALDSMISQRLRRQGKTDFVRRLIEGSEEVYEASIGLSEAIKHRGFDGILYKSRTQTDALCPFNDSMLVIFEPPDSRTLFVDIVLVRNPE